MVSKAFDVSRFRKDITKSITGITTGFHDPVHWSSMGNYVLNWLCTGDFYRGFGYGKVMMLAGEPGSGKSYLAANLMRECQRNGGVVVLFDSESGMDEKWLNDLGVDTSENNLLRINVSMVDDVAKTIAAFMKDWREHFEGIRQEDQARALIVIDSLGNLNTPSDIKQFEAGDLKGDMGRKARAFKALISSCAVQLGNYNVGMAVTNHTYQSQDMFDPDAKITGGGGFLYNSSIILVLQKYKLKADEEGKKTSDVQGIRTTVQLRKSRFHHEAIYKRANIHIRHGTGLNPYSGLIDLFENELELLHRDGNRLMYVDRQGNEHKYFRKDIKEDLLDLIMQEYMQSKREEVDQSGVADGTE